MISLELPERSLPDTYARHQTSFEKSIQPPEKAWTLQGAIDGIIGPGTRQAMEDFERSQDIFPDVRDQRNTIS